MVRDVLADRILVTHHEQTRDPNAIDAIAPGPATFCETERPNDLSIGQIEQRGVGASTIQCNGPPDPLDLEWIEIVPRRLRNDERRVVERTARRLATLNLVDEKRNTDGSPVRVRPSTSIH